MKEKTKNFDILGVSELSQVKGGTGTVVPVGNTAPMVKDSSIT